MFQQRNKHNRFHSAIEILELIFHSTAHSIRKNHNNAFMSILLDMVRALILIAVFFVMFSVLGLRGSAIRGDFLLFVMSGIFLYMTHVKTVGAVMGAEGPASPMMKHAPMNTIIAIFSAALGALYTQLMTLFAILFIYHVAVTPIEIHEPVWAFSCILIAWFTGGAVGLVFLAIKPWAPEFAAIASQLYTRANMIASGKMFVANKMPGYILAMFDWNPLFHAIDQARGFTFVNYWPHYSSMSYPIIVGLILAMIGLMGEFYTRRHVSLSWGAKR